MLRTISTLLFHPPPLPPGVVINTLDDVLVPLSEAHLHSHSHRSRLDSPSSSSFDGTTEGDDTSGQKDDDNDDDDDIEGGEQTGMLLQRSSSSGELLGMGNTAAAEREYTIGSLRREVRKGRGAGGKGEYEMKSRLVNKAIGDIGMGRYNWQLFVLCGFGWFADNLWMQVTYSQPISSAYNMTKKITEKKKRGGKY
ncbi:hypothetical protein QBC41DRAFT_320975 [Cercophora samala]|uniref:Uncharacterized protein n=1 Tax=Cercophora samala TaxID=330535 RepID=A0AA39ZD85_9PEZI|nr:hypothetical protein QBC41DRAFT_320975 [Cercophora samala]